MIRKIFASDFDGTLYFYRTDEKLPRESVGKIREYQAAGHLFGLCTGRQIGSLLPPIAGRLRPDFYITSSGANVLDRDFNPILQMGIDPAMAGAIVRETRPMSRRLLLDAGGELCVFAPLDYPAPCRVIDSVGDAPEGMIHQISVHVESPEEAAQVAAFVNARFGDAVEAFQNVIDVDIAPRGCSKGRAALAVRETMGGTQDKATLYGIGDSINDLTLLEAADVSYTFPYAPEICREKADKIVETIAQALEDSLRD